MSVSTVRFRTSNYSDYLTQVASLIGVDQADLQSPELTMLNNFFNRAYRKIYESQLWPETCPFGEVRFPLDLINAPNDFTGNLWTKNSLTATFLGNEYNPLDNRTNVSLLTPTAVNSPHYVTSLIFGPGTNANYLQLSPNKSYVFSGYAKPNGYNYIVAQFGTGTDFVAASFNMTQPSPLAGTVTASGAYVGLSPAPTLSFTQVANGWFFWSLQFTTPNTYLGGSSYQASVYVSSDGTKNNFVGNGQYGTYLYGVTLSPNTNQVPSSYFIPYNQTGETGIETVFDVWTTDPGNSLVPSRCNYQLSANGINVIGAPNLSPYYLYYRPQRTLFFGITYNASNTYVANQNIYFTSTATLTSGQSNYYTVQSNTTAGQSPDANPSLFQQLFIPYTFLQFCVYNAYADWLMTEGQMAKAQGMYVYAQSCLDDENDKVERQNGNIMPWRVNTHLTSQQRGMGFQNQTYLPQGSYYVN